MKKSVSLILAALFLSGCATYKIQKGQAPYEGGFVAARDGKVLAEYTLGKDNSVPAEEGLARERFKRRRSMVEHYYKKIGDIDNRFKQAFVDPPLMMLHFMTGIFRLPFIALSDHKYEHNPAYRARVQERQAKQDAALEARKRSLKSRLASYVEQDLVKEQVLAAKKVSRPKVEKARRKKAPAAVSQTEAATQALATIEAQEVSEVQEKDMQQAAAADAVEGFESAPAPAAAAVPGQAKAQVKAKAKPKAQAKAKPARVSVAPAAVIKARPQRGTSPLLVKFSAQASLAPGSKIISYEWDFGDGDTSEKKAPSNTYYNMGYNAESYTVTLTVRDSNGNSASATAVIEVLPR
ncbi:MAG: PKD domain-containing protein [Candidatus Omnitrophica bacterium]|nr:PKD domain-containing protein [Candidatus Omnitrophota bacterium]